MKDYLDHYTTLYEACHSLAKQNKMLFAFLYEANQIDQWNQFYKNYNEE